METLSDKIILCQDITGRTLRAVPEDKIKQFIKDLKEMCFVDNEFTFGAMVCAIDQLAGEKLI